MTFSNLINTPTCNH